MRFQCRHALVGLVSMAVMAACTDTTEPDPVSTQGTVQITTTTTGPDPDPDGYIARVVSGYSATATFVPSGGTVDVTVAARTGYVVSLVGVAANCRVAAQGWQGTTRHIDVVAGATVAVSFAVTCGPIPVEPLPPGTQLAFARTGEGIYRVNSDGTGLVRLTEGPSDWAPAWSPDGRRIAFVRGGSGSWSDIYIMDADGSNVVQRTSDDYNIEPTWSPDGALIAFAALSEGSLNVYVMSADEDGTGATAVVKRPGWDGQPAWSPNGTAIAFVSDRVAYDFAADIFVTTPDGVGVSQLTSGFGMWPTLVQFYYPAWSPDGRKLAVVSCPQTYETCDSSTIAVMNADGSGLTTLTAARGMAKPTWSPDGQMIAYSTAGTIVWTRADGSGEGGVIVADGHSPAWRP